MGNPTQRKKLIEVALPLDAINRESAREKSIRHGHPSTLHLWWVRRPLAACRAVLFAQLVDDPSAHPDRFPTEEDQNRERQRLFRIIEDLVKWENINNEQALEAARAEILKSTNGEPPPVLDPFCGGGSIPLEAQRLGLKAYASDLNPVAVLITKALIEIPPRFAGIPPVNPVGRLQVIGDRGQGKESENAEDQISSRSIGLAEGIGHGGAGLRDLQAISQRGDLPSGKSNDPCCGISRGQYRRGPCTRLGQRVHAFSVSSEGVSHGDRDFSRSGFTVGIHQKATGPTRSGEDYRSQQDVDGPEKQTPGEPVTYPLFPTTYTGAKGLAGAAETGGQE